MSEIRPNKTFGPLCARFIEGFLQHGKTFFDFDEAVHAYGKDRQQTTKFLSDLVKRGILARIKSGSFLILQTGTESSQLTNWPIIARELARPEKYYISHYSAMRLHGMTTHGLLDVTVAMVKSQKVREINNITYHFIKYSPKHFWGYSDYWVNKYEKVSVSNIERTLLDGFHRPDLCGGIQEVVKALWVKQHQIDWEKLVDYGYKFQTKAAVKRLGFVLEHLQLGEKYLASLYDLIADAKDYILLDPKGPKVGKYQRSWQVRINLNIDELTEGIWG